MSSRSTLDQTLSGCIVAALLGGCLYPEYTETDSLANAESGGVTTKKGKSGGSAGSAGVRNGASVAAGAGRPTTGSGGVAGVAMDAAGSAGTVAGSGGIGANPSVGGGTAGNAAGSGGIGPDVTGVGGAGGVGASSSNFGGNAGVGNAPGGAGSTATNVSGAAGCGAACDVGDTCGDGKIDRNTGEECDPGQVGQDSRTCNYNCKPSMCGDGHINAVAGEDCEDGNATGGDGCSSKCTREPGWICSTDAGNPDVSTCAPICGNGWVSLSTTGPKDKDEACDDENTNNWDGCNSTCQVESGWQCILSEEMRRDGDVAFTTSEPCFTTCGDGVVGVGPLLAPLAKGAEGEACDDGGTIDGDGCSSDCKKVETGWSCPSASGSGGPCTPICGDAKVVGIEVCDDGDRSNDNGCSSDCRAVKTGWTCPTAGGPCTKDLP